MLPNIADALQVAGAAGPWLALALVLLGIAARIARNARASATRQGERIGELERRADSERDRRRQVEALLLDLAVPLPYWPPDGPDQPRHRRERTFAPYSEPGPWADDGVPLPDDEPMTDFAPERVPVPPLPEGFGARHRRTASI